MPRASTSPDPGTPGRTPGPLERVVPRRAQRPVGVAAAALLVTAALWLRDPHVGGSWGWCPLRAITGLDCPACGGLRAVNDLTHLRLDAAFHSNALLVVAAPVLVAAWAAWLRRSWRGREARTRSPARARILWSVVVVLLVAFAVFRNTPWGHAYWA